MTLPPLVSERPELPPVAAATTRSKPPPKDEQRSVRVTFDNHAISRVQAKHFRRVGFFLKFKYNPWKFYQLLLHFKEVVWSPDIKT